MAFQIHVTRLYLYEGWLGILTNMEWECRDNCISSPRKMSSFLQTKLKWCVFNNLPWIQSLATLICVILTWTIEKLVITLTLRLNLFCLTSNEQTFTYWYEQTLKTSSFLRDTICLSLYCRYVAFRVSCDNGQCRQQNTHIWCTKLEIVRDVLFLSFIRGLWTCDA